MLFSVLQYFNAWSVKYYYYYVKSVKPLEEITRTVLFQIYNFAISIRRRAAHNYNQMIY